MKEYLNIDHIDQFNAMPEERQNEFRKQILAQLREHPVRHLDTEWGCFADLPPMSKEEIDAFADALLEKMTLAQKVNQMSCDLTPANVNMIPERYNSIPYYAGEDFDHDIPAMKFTDGPTGVVLGYHSTAFPVSMARAATFDCELEERVGDVIGIETRSGGANLFAGVCINLLRHPGWGRAQETYGEDPYLLGRMGSSLVKGVQRHAMACVKHFIANSMENARFRVSVDMDERTLREMYLPHFKACVDAGAASIMSAYNRFRDEWCGHNEYLLKKILKEEWGFDGFVMSDFIYGIRGTVGPANAGLDIEMNATQFYGRRLCEAVEQGLVPEENINEAVRRILRKKIEFSSVGDKSGYKEEKMGCAEHAKLALEVAQKSMVLLKNDGLLPLDRKKTKRVLVAGDLAVLGAIGDMKGSSAVFPPYVVTALEGIRKAAGGDVEVSFLRGIVTDEVKQLGKGYDAVIIYVGLTHENEGEYFPAALNYSVGGDRMDLGLTAKQQELIEMASEGNENTIVCLQGGSAISVEAWKDKAKAIVMQWYSGMEGGTALGQILFGDVNPSGKLPVTIHADAQQLPYFGLDLSNIEYDYYHGYFKADKYKQRVSYPFGFGLSYTSFSYKNLRVSAAEMGVDGELTVLVDVTNTGERGGDEVVQLYIGYAGSAVERHVKDLKGFARVHLAPQQTKTVRLAVRAEDLAYYCVESKSWVTEKITYTAYVGSSSAQDDLLSANFQIK